MENVAYSQFLVALSDLLDLLVFLFFQFVLPRLKLSVSMRRILPNLIMFNLTPEFQSPPTKPFRLSFS